MAFFSPSITSSTLAPTVALGVDGDAVAAEAADEAVGLLVAQLGAADVADIDRHAVAAGEDGVFDLLGRAELAERADDVAPLAFPEVAAGGVFVLAAEGQRARR